MTESNRSFALPGLRNTLFVLLIAAIVLLIDRSSKLWVVDNLALYEGWAPIAFLDPFFQIFHTTNTGVAFGLFRDAGAIFIAVRAIAIVAILIISLRESHASPWLALGLGLIMGGAAGNLWDGLAYGHVVDFLHFSLSDTLSFPTFNVADSGITVGVICVALFFLRQERQQRQLAEQM